MAIVTLFAEKLKLQLKIDLNILILIGYSTLVETLPVIYLALHFARNPKNYGSESRI